MATSGQTGLPTDDDTRGYAEEQARLGALFMMCQRQVPTRIQRSETEDPGKEGDAEGKGEGERDGKTALLPAESLHLAKLAAPLLVTRCKKVLLAAVGLNGPLPKLLADHVQFILEELV